MQAATAGIDCWGQSFTPDAVANLTSIGVTKCSSGTLSVRVDGNNHITITGFAESYTLPCGLR